MDRVLQLVWDRCGARYSWAIWAITFLIGLPVWLVWSLAAVAVEGSGHYLEAVLVTVTGLVLFTYILVLPGLGSNRLVERWASGREVDRKTVLDATYSYARRALGRGVGGGAVAVGALLLFVASIAGATGWRLVQYAILGS